MTNKQIVSVCISVYNGEKFLNRCIDSVLTQNIDSMEIVLVDDGSTDNTLQIMQGYKKNYPEKNIRIIQQEHYGLAQGRWTGVKNSRGDYITFLDADDYLFPGAYRVIINFLQTNTVDIYEFQTIREGYLSKSRYSGIMDAKRVLTDYFNGAPIPVNYWLRWFKRDLFTEQMFPKNISLHEDVYAFPCILSRAKNIAYINQPLHVHTKDNKASIMNRHYADCDEHNYFERQKILLFSIPHIERNIDQLNSEYNESFLHYKLGIYRKFIFMRIKSISYSEKLEAIITTLGLDVSPKELERYISRNMKPNSKLNWAIRYLGLHNAYRLFGLKNKSCVKRVLYTIKRAYNWLIRKGRKIKYKTEALLFSNEMICYCPCCGIRFKSFISGHFQDHPERYNPVRYENTRQDVICQFCGSLPRHRILASWCEKNVKPLRSSDILYLAPETSMMLWMKRKRISCTTADMYHKADLAIDIQNTGLSGASYDYIFCNHVLEHVDDYTLALKEIYRILKPGGSLICSFPIDPTVEIVDEDENIKTDAERYAVYGQVDHNRVFGIKADILLADAGFTVETIDGADCSDEILPIVGPADYDINRLFCCRKS